MIPAITTGGRSFAGAFAYYMHDKGAKTTSRIAWTHTINMMTSCVEKAHKVMAYTAMAQQRLKEAAGQKLSVRKLEKPVFAYSLAWHPEQKPDREAMLEAANETLEALGLTEHEIAIAAHKDEPHRHIHIIVNRVHPVTGKAANLSHSKRKLSAWALEYERKTGKVYCMQREENHTKRMNKQPTRYVNPAIAGAWIHSEEAADFQHRLEEKGYQLARGRKRLVVVDPYDKTVNPVRHLKGVTTKTFHEHLNDLDMEKLPTPEQIIRQRKDEQERYQKRLAAYEERATGAKDHLLSSHKAAWDKAAKQEQQKIDKQSIELADHFQLDEKHDRIMRLQDRLDNPGFFQKLKTKFLGTDWKLVEEIEIYKASEDIAIQKFNEAVGELKKERDIQLQMLEHSFNEKAGKLTKQLEQWKPSEPSYLTARSRDAAEFEKDRGRDGNEPCLGR